MRITSEGLQAEGACADQVARFAQLFPEGVDVTQESCRIAAENGLKFNFLAVTVFSRRKYHEYLKRIKPAYKRWESVKDDAAQRELNMHKALAFRWVLEA